MTLEILKSADFKQMPWKNGGGVTTELYRLSNSEDSFLFRISIAQVKSDGPFSLFAGIDRTLLLLEGNGFHLKGSTLDFTLKDSAMISFTGEEAIQCSLINGECTDFNVMTNRTFAKSEVTRELISTKTLKRANADCDLKFIYAKEENTLYKLILGDSLEMHFDKPTTLITVDVRYL